MSGFSAFPYPGSSIVADAAAAASADLKRAKSSSGRAYATSRGNEERLRRRSRKMAKEFSAFRDKMEQKVKSKLDRMSGPDDNRKRGMKVAQFIPGKGLEIQGVQQHKDAPIYCSLGEKSQKLVDPLEETFKTISGKQISIDFAFKLVNEPNLRDLNKKSRVTALNCFRHVNPDSFNYQKTGSYVSPVNDDQKTANLNWHTTLGPDAAFVRRGTDGLSADGVDAGVWRTASNDTRSVGGFAKHWDGSQWVTSGDNEAGLANSLVSPYRTPSDFEIMYSRINRQVMENYGFALNRFKFLSQVNSSNNFPPAQQNLYVWGSPTTDTLNFGETANTSEDYLKASYPAYINTELISNFAENQTQGSWTNPYYEYHSQFGAGRLSYQFSNDGTNPVCIDICVVGIKKGQTVPVNLLEKLCSFNYGVNKYSNQHRLNVNGYQGNVDSGQQNIDWDFANQEWHTDAKLPFMPDECFKNPQSYLDAAPITSTYDSRIYDLLEQGKKNPFKVVKRDQFIVSSGSTRAWNTTLPSIKYRPQLYEDVTYPETLTDADLLTPTADEYTYVLCIGAHGMSTPVEELYPSQTTNPDGSIRTRDKAGSDPVVQEGVEVLKKAIIDHEPTSCSVSVVGTYTEIVKPAFPKNVSDRTFINGRLMLPHFAASSPAGSRIAPPATEEEEYPPRLSSVDVSTQGQIVRTTDTGVTGVGAINPAVGA